MNGTPKDKAQYQQQSATDLAEKALEIVIKNTNVNKRTTKALRLTCKRTKLAANARVKQFTLAAYQEPEDVERSGLLNNITNLRIDFYLRPSRYENSNYSQILSCAFGLLNLAVDVCSKSLKHLEVQIIAPAETIQACASILANSVWKSLQELMIDDLLEMPGFLEGFPCGPADLKPGSLPALTTFCCQNPCAADVDFLSNSGFFDRLATLNIIWSIEANRTNKAPAMIAAMRNLLHKATNLESLHVTSSTFDFFDHEQLTSLKFLHLEAATNSVETGNVQLTPALARPWPTLESLHIQEHALRLSDRIRIFSAEDTLPVLKELTFERCVFKPVPTDAERSYIRRPHLEKFSVLRCRRGQALLAELADQMKWVFEEPGMPSLREFYVNYQNHAGNNYEFTPKEALSQFLSCPCVAALEILSIQRAEIAEKSGSELLYKIAEWCPKLKDLDLRSNDLKKPAVALLLGLGIMGAWPKLEKLGGVLDDQNKWDSENPSNMPKLDAQRTLRRAWPGLQCYETVFLDWF